jgi:methionyl-tRNA synthetase
VELTKHRVCPVVMIAPLPYPISCERSIYLVKISKELFKELQKLGYIKFSKYSKNYSKSKRYRYVEDSVLKEYKKYLG